MESIQQWLNETGEVYSIEELNKLWHITIDNEQLTNPPESIGKLSNPFNDMPAEDNVWLSNNYFYFLRSNV